MELETEEQAYAVSSGEWTELRALDTLAARNTGAPNLYLVDREVATAVDVLAGETTQRGLSELSEANDGVWEARRRAPQ